MLAAFLLMFTRIAAMVCTAPILGSRAVSLKHRILISLALTTVCFSAFSKSDSLSQSNQLALDANLVAPMLAEISIGVALGLGTLIIFSAAQMAGNVLGQLAGLQFFDQLDPSTGGTASPIGQLFGLTSLAAFALMDGPDIVIGSVLQTFHHLPIGAPIQSANLMQLLPELLQQSFVLAISGVGPGIAAMLATSLVFGFVCRSYPQMNLTSLAMGSNVAIMFMAVFLTLGGCVFLFMDDLGPSLELIQNAIQQAPSSTGPQR